MVRHNYNESNKVTQTKFHNTPERKLWLAVLGAAAEDAVSDAEFDMKGYPRIHKSADIAYFTEPTRSFFTVCAYAGLDPEYVLRKMRRAIDAKQT